VPLLQRLNPAVTGLKGADDPASPELPAGLSSAEAQRRRDSAAGGDPDASSRSYASIVRANLLTVFNAILAGFGVLTLVFGDPRDALFLTIIVGNAGIGITQEIRAKRALDRLSLLVAPQARVRRDGQVRQLAVSEVVVGDVVALQPGDQVVADGRLLTARELRLDESVLTGESEPVRRIAGEPLRSGAFVAEGSGSFEVMAVGADSYAARITGQARTFRHPRSPLEQAINRLLYVLVALVVGLGAVLGFALAHRHVAIDEAVATSAAGVVSLVPEGLVLLVGLTYAVAAVRMARHGVLAQQLNAIESLASVDTICVDKTGTLTEARLRVVEALPAEGVTEAALRSALGLVAASASSRNLTLAAIADACPGEARPASGEIPFASRRRWSAVSMDGASFYLGAPGVVTAGDLTGAAEDRQRRGRRVLSLARGNADLPPDPAAPPDDLQPLGSWCLARSSVRASPPPSPSFSARGCRSRFCQGTHPRRWRRSPRMSAYRRRLACMTPPRFLRILKRCGISR
jgi:cation-transporting ATPase E